MTQVPLSATEEAFVAMVQEEHAALIRNADAKRNARLAVLFKDKGIPDGITVNITPKGEHESAYLTYTE